MAGFNAVDFTARIQKDKSYGIEMCNSFNELIALTLNNLEYLKDKEGEYIDCLFSSFIDLCDHLRGIEDDIVELIGISHRYDFDASTPANGYRSMVILVHKCVSYIHQLSLLIFTKRSSLLFRLGHYSDEVVAYVTVLGQLRACCHYLRKISQICPEGVLIPDEDVSFENNIRCESVMIEIEQLSQDCFYGRCLGYQFCDSLRPVLKGVGLAMASYSDHYEQGFSAGRTLASSLISGAKYLMNDEARAEKTVEVTRTGGIEFCKAFWDLGEHWMIHKSILIRCPRAQVDREMSLEPESFALPGVNIVSLVRDENWVTIPVASAHVGPKPIKCRLISHQVREGQEEARRSAKPRSTGLIIHFHGGGFVGQSSASHEGYLRQWAKETDTPIFCVDYSLAPECPFPRQQQEGFFAYCWALKHCFELGSTAERVVICGDSAGANIAMAVTLSAISAGVRKPDAIFSAYGAMLVKYIPSPSRILTLMDPLLSIGTLSACLSAYAGISEDSSSSSNISSSLQNLHLHEEVNNSESNIPTYAKTRHFPQSPTVLFRQLPKEKNHLMSPYQASDELLRQLPPITLLACQLDPLLDDSVMLAKRLRQLGNEVTLDIQDDLPHGFLNFVQLSKDAQQGSDLCVSRIKQILMN